MLILLHTMVHFIRLLARICDKNTNYARRRRPPQLIRDSQPAVRSSKQLQLTAWGELEYVFISLPGNLECVVVVIRNSMKFERTYNMCECFSMFAEFN